MCLVVHNGEVLELILENGRWLAIDRQARQRIRGAFQLLIGLIIRTTLDNNELEVIGGIRPISASQLKTRSAGQKTP